MSLAELTTEVAVLKQRILAMELNLEAYAKTQKEQHNELKTEINWLMKKVIYFIGAIMGIGICVNIAIQFFKK